MSTFKIKSMFGWIVYCILLGPFFGGIIATFSVLLFLMISINDWILTTFFFPPAYVFGFVIAHAYVGGFIPAGISGGLFYYLSTKKTDFNASIKDVKSAFKIGFFVTLSFSAIIILLSFSKNNDSKDFSWYLISWPLISIVGGLSALLCVKIANRFKSGLTQESKST